MKPILIGCEESQTICQAFKEAGFEAYSCDLQPTRGNPGFHFQQDIMEVIPTREWGLIILHPDCTAMAVSGNRWYGRNMPYHQQRLDQVSWTMKLWKLANQHSDRVALENPVSVIFTELGKLGTNIQYIQPWQFGHGETKKTGLALSRLPELEATNIVEGREQRIWKMGPSETRKRDRSETFKGIADAIVSQWGALLR